MSVEVLLQLLVCVVYTQLLEAVALETFEAKDVEDAKLGLVLHVRCILQRLHLGGDGAVYLADNPVEQLAVDRFGARVSR